ncbi:EI24 domain-containing protein [Actinocorallia lasiicapitis]
MKGLFSGVRFLARGFAWCAARPQQWLFGLIPALIAAVLFGALLTMLAFQADDLAAFATPFADDWSSGGRDTLRLLAAVLLFGLGGLLSVILFTAVTLLIGEPFYEALSGRVEESEGGAPPAPDVPLWRQAVRAVRDTLILGVIATLFAVAFFFLGFIPVVGQTVIPVLAALVTGYFLTGELTSIALDRRSYTRKERFALLKANRFPTLAFGLPLVLLFLIPFGAVLFMPPAIAAATLYARSLTPTPPPKTLTPPPMA